MRALILIAAIAVGACGETQVGNKAVPAPPSAAAPSPGQWELTSEVTRFRAADDGAPKINTPAGTRATQRICLAAGSLPAEMLVGEGYDCRSSNDYVHNGRISVNMTCRRSGLAGDILVTVNGTFTSDGMEFTRGVRSQLSTQGDVEIDSTVTGRRVGDCPAGGSAPAEGD